MAFTLDFATLDELGLGSLPTEDKRKMLSHILETLEMRVGTTLANQMTDEQLDEFERLMPTEQDNPTTIQEKEKSALKWLENNFPTYKDVVENELKKLMTEIRQVAPQILADTAKTSNQTTT
jgi:hypothetical protein